MGEVCWVAGGYAYECRQTPESVDPAVSRWDSRAFRHKATDRFQRAAYFMGVLPEPEGEREAVASVLATVRNCSMPFGAPYGVFGIYNTEYRTVMNLTSRRYYFELTTSLNVVWADLDRFDMEPGAPVMAPDPDSIEALNWAIKIM
jgi:penicillin V acylase-like amidase (Ntn superfamily)